MRSPAIFVQSVCCPCPQLYSSLPVPCRAALRRPLGFLFSATSASSAHSALTLLLASCYLFAVICYPLSPRNQPIFLPPKKKRRKLSPPPSIRSKFAIRRFFLPRTPAVLWVPVLCQIRPDHPPATSGSHPR